MIASYSIQLASLALRKQNSLLTETIRHFVVIQTQINTALIVLHD